jgi:WD40 repeat protein
VYAIGFAPDNTLLVYYPLIGWRKDRPIVVVRFVDPVTGREVRPATELTEAPVANSGDFSADGRLLAIGGDDARTVSLWDPVTAKRIITLGTLAGSVPGVTFSPDGQLLAAIQDDDRVVLWDVPRGREHLSPRFAATSATLTPDGRTLALGDSLGAVTLLNVATGQQVARLHGPSDDGSIRALALSPDGAVLATGGKARVIRLWELSSGKLLGTLVGHADYLECLAFSPDGRTLASGSRDETVRIWSVTSGRELLRFEMSGLINHLEFAPDGRTLAGAGAVGGRDAICLWSTVPAADSAQRSSAGNGKSEATQ